MSAIDMRERLRPFGISFEKSLEDLIKGIRAINNDQEKLESFFDKSIQECKTELKSTNLDLKSIAILKLAYLEMYGFDMSWCSFSILEVMASQKFQHKRIGYLAAIQILQRQNNDDALMLMTNLLKKDLNSSNYAEASLAISGVAAVVSKDLALDLCDDVAKLLTHSRPLIRKKAVLAIYKIFLKNPEALRIYYERIVEKLEDADSSVVSATVNVICELAHMNPSNYIELAPIFYKMMKESKNNWMVIRLLKLFSSLSLVEPRLKNKILPEIIELMQSTKALSLAYECINAILNGNMLTFDDIDTGKAITEKLLTFFESNDQNLKYVGLLAFIKTCKIHQNLIKKYDKIILTSIYDNDITIRETSLEIVNSLVSEDNIVTIVTRLMVQLLPFKEQQNHLEEINNKISRLTQDSESDVSFMIGSLQQPVIVSDKYKILLINKIIEICSMNNYENIPHFKWYLRVLNDILKLNSVNKLSNVDKLISDQFIDISLRVPSIRSDLVQMCLNLIGIPKKSEEELLLFKNGLSNCIWIVGEYYDEYIQEEEDTDTESEKDSDSESVKEIKFTVLEIINIIREQNFLQRLGYMNFDKTLTIYIQSIAKIFSKFCNAYGKADWSISQFEFIRELSTTIVSWFVKFEHSPNFEVQERAVSFIEILKLVGEAISGEIDILKSSGLEFGQPPLFLINGYNQLFLSRNLKPVGLKTQNKVQIPIDLDLETAIDGQAMSDFQELYNKITLEDLNIDLESDKNESSDDDYADDGDFENENIIDDLLDEDREQDVSYTKKTKDNHDDDPYYISIADSIVPEANETKAVDIRKKQKKPKKYKKEKVLVIDDDEDHIEESPKNTKKTQLMIDSTNLANIDLKQEELTRPNTEVFANEYEVDDENQGRAEQPLDLEKSDVIKIEVPAVKTTKKKIKKKIKKKMAVIE